MKKTQTENKYLLVFTILIALISFLFFLGAALTYNYFAGGAIGILILIGFSIGFASLLSFGLAIFSSTVKDAMITMRRMLRIDNLSNPLILRLAEEAPGTYHHSINVSHIAQNAAKSIKANSLLVRIASYYHDIGKLEAPLSFIENQGSKEIPQDENAEYIRGLAKDIISHVPEGVKIAKEYHLPEDIIDLIREHHGTARVLYCYEKAKERGLKIKRTDFRYPGPKPQSKESVVLMLADNVEAAARASDDLSESKIKEIVDNTINDKISDKQLAFPDLAKSDIEKIRNSLIKSLNAIYHQRIKYSQNEN